MAIEEDVYCTLVTSDNYLPGAAVLAHSLRDAATKRKLAVLVTVESLRYDTLTELKVLYDYVIPVDRIKNPNPSNLYLIDRGDLLYTFTKINLWRLVQFRKVIYIDADVVALRAPDELFETKASFAAASDIGWPDIFNTGVMVLSPDMGTYWALQTLASSGDTFDGADQGLLNQYFEHKDWRRLPFTYNCTPSASYQYEPAYRYHKSQISMVHFIGQQKPWTRGRSGVSGSGHGAYRELLNQWWATYDRHYRYPLQNGQGSSATTTTVPSLVAGESNQSYYGEYSAPSQSSGIDIEEHTSSAADSSTAEQRKFSASYNEWDATQAAPPTTSRPEALNFPTQSYEFTGDTTPFKAPQHYPSPPKDMWYQVPADKPFPATARPPPIFPWEDRPITKPTRVFSDDPVTATTSSEAYGSGGTNNNSGQDESTPPTPIIRVNDEQLPTMEPVPRNAWDDIAGIDSYIRQLSQFQKLRGKLQVLQNEPHESLSPALEDQPNPMDVPGGDAGNISPGSGPSDVTETHPDARRESIILTDFPTATERPSLPVTPAAVRRNMFWGEERNAAGQLPAADGVPEQQDWNPTAKLEQLRLSSLSLDPSSLVLPAKNVPRRDMPRTSIDMTALSSGPNSPEKTVMKPKHAAHVRFRDERLESVREITDSGLIRLAAAQAEAGESADDSQDSDTAPPKNVRVGFGEVRFG